MRKKIHSREMGGAKVGDRESEMRRRGEINMFGSNSLAARGMGKVVDRETEGRTREEELTESERRR